MLVLSIKLILLCTEVDPWFYSTCTFIDKEEKLVYLKHQVCMGMNSLICRPIVLTYGVWTVYWLNKSHDQVTKMTLKYFLYPQSPLVGADQFTNGWWQTATTLRFPVSGTEWFSLFSSALEGERSRAGAVERVMVVCQTHHLSSAHFTRRWSVHFATWKPHSQSRSAPIFFRKLFSYIPNWHLSWNMTISSSLCKV